MFIFLKMNTSFEGNFIILHNPILKLHFSVSFCCDSNWEKWDNYLRDFSFIYLLKDNLPLGIPEKLNFCYNYKIDEITFHHKCICLRCSLRKTASENLHQIKSEGFDLKLSSLLRGQLAERLISLWLMFPFH